MSIVALPLVDGDRKRHDETCASKKDHKPTYENPSCTGPVYNLYITFI